MWCLPKVLQKQGFPKTSSKNKPRALQTLMFFNNDRINTLNTNNFQNIWHNFLIFLQGSATTSSELKLATLAWNVESSLVTSPIVEDMWRIIITNPMFRQLFVTCARNVTKITILSDTIKEQHTAFISSEYVYKELYSSSLLWFCSN